MRYRSEISGLRAIAVMPVVLFHAGFNSFSGGFIGVDVFFVISGYLIALLLIDEVEKGEFDLVRFYKHRARRIFPALFFVMISCVPLAWLSMEVKEISDFSNSLLAATLFVSNFYFWKSSDYFSESVEANPLLHTWSLAVEEQFYLFFPLLLLISWKAFKNRTVLFFIILACISFIFSEFYLQMSPVASFYLLPTRAWELLSGVLAAFYVNKKGEYPNNKLAALGLFLIFGSILMYDKSTPTPGVFTFFPVFGAVLIIVCASGSNLVGSFLGYRILAGIGLVSYSIYLIHQPVFAFSRILFGELEIWMMCMFSLLSIFLAVPCWKFIEQPFRYQQQGKKFRTKIYPFSVSVMIVLICFGLLGRYSENILSDKNKNQTYSLIAEFPNRENGFCFYSLSDVSLGLEVGQEGINCTLNGSGKGIRGLLIGDSFAAQYEPLWKKLAIDLDLSIRSITTNSCFPSLDESFKINATGKAREQCLYNRKFFKNNIEDFDVLILGAAWGDYLKYDFQSEILKIVNKAVARDKKVVLMSAPRYYRLNLLDLYNRALMGKEEIDYNKNYLSGLDKQMSSANSMLKNISKDNENVFFVDRNSLFESGRDGVNDWTVDGIPYSYDKRHISVSGSEAAAVNFMKSDKYQELVKVLSGSY